MLKSTLYLWVKCGTSKSYNIAMVKKRRKNSILNEFTNEGLMVIGLMGAAVVTFVCLIVLFLGGFM